MMCLMDELNLQKKPNFYNENQSNKVVVETISPLANIPPPPPPPCPPLPSLSNNNFKQPLPSQSLKSCNKIQVKKEQDIMSNLLQELSQVKKSVIHYLQTPRKAYLDRKHTLDEDDENENNEEKNYQKKEKILKTNEQGRMREKENVSKPPKHAHETTPILHKSIQKT
jgi:hypothetical protein